MKVLGIDPGMKGGYALIEDGNRVLQSGLLPVHAESKEVDVVAFANLFLLDVPDLVVLEEVGARGKDGVKSMFTFGKGYGMLLALCALAEWQLILVKPQRWKKIVLEGTTRTKAVTCAYVRRRFKDIDLRPGRTTTDQDGLADAACIAEYGFLYLQGRSIRST